MRRPKASALAPTEPIKHLGLRIPLSLHQKLVKRAAKDRRSLTSEVLTLLEEALRG